MNRLALVSFAASAIASVASAQLVVTEVAQQTVSGTLSTINGDWWELTNAGGVAIDLTGYQWADTEDALPSTDSNFFPSVMINPGQSIIILEEVLANIPAWRTNWGLDSSVIILGTDNMIDDSTPDGDTFSGLGSADDGVLFYSPAGALLSSYTYTTTIRGTSFEAARNGTNLGFSVVGENGAYAALSNNIGSPGVSIIPAPGALALGGLAGILIGRRRR